MEPSGVLICGPYGTGKSTVAEEIATRLEADGVPFAAIDLDWLMWFDTGTGDEEVGERLGLENVADVVENDLAAGIQRFVFAGWFADQQELDAFRAVVAFPLTAVQLTAPWETIERRLRSSPTAARLEDLPRARQQVDAAEGPAVHATIDGDRPVADVAEDILRLLRWLPEV
jgi:shikimate kinase